MNKEPGINRWLPNVSPSHPSLRPPLRRRRGRTDWSVHLVEPESAPAVSILPQVSAIPKARAVGDLMDQQVRHPGPLRLEPYKLTEAGPKTPSTLKPTQLYKGRSNRFALNSSSERWQPGFESLLNLKAQPFDPKAPMPPPVPPDQNVPDLVHSQYEFGESILDRVRQAMGLPPVDYYHDSPQIPGITLCLDGPAGGESYYFPGHYYKQRVEYEYGVKLWEAGRSVIAPAKHHSTPVKPHYSGEPCVEYRWYDVPQDWRNYREVYGLYDDARHSYTIPSAQNPAERDTQFRNSDGTYVHNEPTVEHATGIVDIDRSSNASPDEQDDDASLYDDPRWEGYAGSPPIVNKNSTRGGPTASQQVWPRDVSGSTWLTAATTVLSVHGKAAAKDTAQTSPTMSYAGSPNYIGDDDSSNNRSLKPGLDNDYVPDSSSLFLPQEPSEQPDWEASPYHEAPQFRKLFHPKRSATIPKSPKSENNILNRSFRLSSCSEAESPTSEPKEKFVDWSTPHYRWPIAMAEIIPKGERWRRRSVTEGMLPQQED